MVQQLQPTAIDSDCLYPESDGKPLSDNTVQFCLITKLRHKLRIRNITSIPNALLNSILIELN